MDNTTRWVEDTTQPTSTSTVLSQGLFAWEIRLRLGVTCSSMDFTRFVGRPPLFFFLTNGLGVTSKPPFNQPSSSHA
ncbi:hypothetical protein J6590_076430 [Homalodisca vitripennis]|nr:hypothetical protein J6590_076430 [Homalodisca vitripennis]